MHSHILATTCKSLTANTLKGLSFSHLHTLLSPTLFGGSKGWQKNGKKVSKFPVSYLSALYYIYIWRKNYLLKKSSYNIIKKGNCYGETD